MPDNFPPWLSGTSLDFPDVMGQQMTADQPTCSAKGCQLDAQWELLWNNPKIHPPERRKTWLACEAHRISLSDFLGARGFLKDVVAHEE